MSFSININPNESLINLKNVFERLQNYIRENKDSPNIEQLIQTSQNVKDFLAVVEFSKTFSEKNPSYEVDFSQQEKSASIYLATIVATLGQLRQEDVENTQCQFKPCVIL